MTRSGQAAALVAFTLGHSYLGARGAARAGLGGLVAAALFVWSGSLLPSMLLHAAADAAGWLGYTVLASPAARATASS